MAEQEGVIKFNLNHAEADFTPPAELVKLESWRTLLRDLGLIGQTPNRYAGLGFGNASLRVPISSGDSDTFIITGTQTGGMTHMTRNHYALVKKCDLTANKITSIGLTKPSSEALTHASLYQASNSVNCVIHAHSPDIWLNAEALTLPATDKSATYGTPAMAESVRQLISTTETNEKKVFIMPGHEDGVVSFGNTIEQAVLTMIMTLQRARQLTSSI